MSITGAPRSATAVRLRQQPFGEDDTAGPTSALPIQTSAGGHGVNYDGPGAAPATESGSGPPLPSMDHGHVLGDGLCTPCCKAPAAEGRTACEPCLEQRRVSTEPGMQPPRPPARSTAAPAWTPSAVAPGRAAAGARPSAARRVFGSGAASVRRSRAGRPAPYLCNTSLCPGGIILSNLLISRCFLSPPPIHRIG